MPKRADGLVGGVGSWRGRLSLDLRIGLLDAFSHLLGNLDVRFPGREEGQERLHAIQRELAARRDDANARSVLFGPELELHDGDVGGGERQEECQRHEDVEPERGHVTLAAALAKRERQFAGSRDQRPEGAQRAAVPIADAVGEFGEKTQNGLAVRVGLLPARSAEGAGQHRAAVEAGRAFRRHSSIATGSSMQVLKT